jgi:hypothetical protein
MIIFNNSDNKPGSKDLLHFFIYLRADLKMQKANCKISMSEIIQSVLNGPFIKRNFVLIGNIYRSRDYHSIPWLNVSLASAEKCSGPLRFRLRQVSLYLLLHANSLQKPITELAQLNKNWRKRYRNVV